MKYLLIFCFSLSLPAGQAGFAFEGMAQQDSCACCTADHQAFDFWVGEWVVFDTSGTQIGENRIHKIEGDCILQEHWTGASGSTGSSFNYFNKQDSSWNQLWVDNAGNPLILKGRAKDQQMIMESDLVPGRQIDFYKNQIIWTLNADASVTQTWNILDKEGKILQTVFVGIYRKK